MALRTTYRLRLLGWDLLTLSVDAPTPAPEGEATMSSYGGQFEIGFCHPYEQGHDGRSPGWASAGILPFSLIFFIAACPWAAVSLR